MTRRLLLATGLILLGFMGSGYGQITSPLQTQSPAPGVVVPPPRVHRGEVRQIVRLGKDAHGIKTSPTAQPQPQAHAPVHHNNPPNAKPHKPAPTITFTDATRRHHREHHDRWWWRNHYTTIVFVTGGYYYWDAGYWFPAWGYDPAYDYYEYDGPIFTYGNLLPDQVIINVQRVLLQLGYYTGGINGSLNQATRGAIAAYQRDQGLDVTGGIDEPLVEALGLY